MGVPDQKKIMVVPLKTSLSPPIHSLRLFTLLKDNNYSMSHSMSHYIHTVAILEYERGLDE